MTKLLLDGDPGHDDAVAILVAAQRLELLAVTTVFGNAPVEATTRNALAILELAGLEVPVAAGAARSLLGEPPPAAGAAHGGSGLDGVALPEPRRAPLGAHAVELLIETARAHREELVVALTGPQTNMALALRLEPRLPRWLRAVAIMGGSAGPGNVRPMACRNVVADPEAAYIVFGCGAPIFWLGFETSRTVLLREGDLARLRAGGRVARTVAALLDFYRQRYRRIYGAEGAPIHDALALLPWLRPDAVRLEPVALEVALAPGPTRGMTVVDRRGIRPDAGLPAEQMPKPANVQMAAAIDRDAAVETILEALLAYP
ncbi:MAG: hypothetical protein KatS3mg117_2656 [Geminicoccaceae bacterium]|nr:MAG: hypothetical protein KatS3mg117_2656 [Geminicoccaceae bacterium]